MNTRTQKCRILKDKISEAQKTGKCKHHFEFADLDCEFHHYSSSPQIVALPYGVNIRQLHSYTNAASFEAYPHSSNTIGIPESSEDELNHRVIEL